MLLLKRLFKKLWPLLALVIVAIGVLSLFGVISPLGVNDEPVVEAEKDRKSVV